MAAEAIVEGSKNACNYAFKLYHSNQQQKRKTDLGDSSTFCRDAYLPPLQEKVDINVMSAIKMKSESQCFIGGVPCLRSW